FSWPTAGVPLTARSALCIAVICRSICRLTAVSFERASLRVFATSVGIHILPNRKILLLLLYSSDSSASTGWPPDSTRHGQGVLRSPDSIHHLQEAGPILVQMVRSLDSEVRAKLSREERDLLTTELFRASNQHDPAVPCL